MRDPGKRTSRPGTPAIRKLVPPLLAWFATNARDLPWRNTRDPYAIWVSEIMLQQTQVNTVIPYWERWLGELPTIESAAKASDAKLHKLWEGLGYYTRVRNLQRAAREIVAQHNGKFPENYDHILALPGIGRYTAGAIASIAFNQPQALLDGNVIRVLTRIFGITSDPRAKQTNAQLWELAEQLVHFAAHATSESRPCSQLNQSLMELGALVCSPRSPDCGACPVMRFCVAHRRGLQEKLPKLARRASATPRRFVAFVIESKGKFLVCQRPAGVVNAHLWELPSTEISTSQRPARRISTPRLAKLAMETTGLSGLRLAGDKPLCTIRHSITRYRITLEAWLMLCTPSAKVSAPTRRAHWLSRRQLRSRAFTSAHRRILALTESLGHWQSGPRD